LSGREGESAERSLALATPREQLDVVPIGVAAVAAAVLEPDPAGRAGDEIGV